MNKFPGDRHRILNMDERIIEIENLIEDALDESTPIEELSGYIDEISYLMHNKYYGPFRLQGKSIRDIRIQQLETQVVEKPQLSDRSLKIIKKD